MNKHIHIYLHRAPAIKGRTGDSGNFDESKHKRDDDGKFSSGGGGGGAKKSEGKSAPIKHASATGQSFLPKQSPVAAGSVVKTGSGFTAKNPQGFKEFFKPHEEAQAKAWAAGAPRKDSGTERSYMGKGNHQPGWMLRADPVLAKKVREAEARRSERSATAKQGPSYQPPAAKPKLEQKGTWVQASVEGGQVGGHVKGDTLRITHADLDESQQGKGLGSAMYRAVIDDALGKGLKVESDNTVETPAVRVYESLAKQGYKVTKNPKAFVIDEGMGAPRGEPVFYVSK